MEKSHEIAQEVAGKMPRASELTYALVNQAAGCTLTFRIPGYVTVLLGRALEWHSRGQRFDPAYLHHQWRKPMKAPDILSGAFLFCKALLFP